MRSSIHSVRLVSLRRSMRLQESRNLFVVCGLTMDVAWRWGDLVGTTRLPLRGTQGGKTVTTGQDAQGLSTTLESVLRGVDGMVERPPVCGAVEVEVGGDRAKEFFCGAETVARGSGSGNLVSPNDGVAALFVL